MTDQSQADPAMEAKPEKQPTLQDEIDNVRKNSPLLAELLEKAQRVFAKFHHSI